MKPKFHQVQVLLFLFLANSARAQQNISKKNMIYVEGFGSAITFSSINYDRTIKQWDRCYLSTSIGFGYDAFQILDNDRSFSLNKMGKITIGKNSGRLEFATGLAYNQDAGLTSYVYNGVKTYIAYRETRMIWLFGMQYKYQRSSGGFFFKGGFTPNGPICSTREPCLPNSFVCLQDIDLLFHFIGVSVGYSF